MLDPKPMEPAIRQYDFTAPQITLSWQKKVCRVFLAEKGCSTLAVGCLAFGFRWILKVFCIGITIPSLEL
jgi:hypothetical protein